MINMMITIDDKNDDKRNDRYKVTIDTMINMNSNK